ncbi:hypothetical protein DdX_12132 [Ditylenchus destructor]|uniref:Uncharacterized protein n=1 Tax=Ditylenchus destructor TaxID=166010 RepID=A0AAD4R3P8_9BILA|nr:hypothetical protein DdX_12132 [Ditylenchus destructor]
MQEEIQNRNTSSTRIPKQHKSSIAYRSWISTVSLWLYTLLFICPNVAMAIPINVLRLYLDDAPQGMYADNREILVSPHFPPPRPPAFFIFDGDDAQEDIRNMDDEESRDQIIANIISSPFSKRRTSSPLQSQISEDIEKDPSSIQMNGAPERQQLLRIERNFHDSNPETGKMYQIQNVGDLPMFRFG